MLSRRTFIDLSRRLLAAGCAMLVLALTLVSVSPAAHEWLHAAEQEHSCPHHAKSKTPPPSAAEHDCAVVLFASGVDLAVGPFALTPPRAAVAGISPVTAAELHLASPRYLRQPERGPPSAWVS